ncbi:MAG: ribonuclease P protein component [Flavobacteriaceae bacterium]
MNKLKGRKNIKTLFETGEKIFKHPLCLFYKKNNDMAYGISVGKGSFSLAVERNKIKRQLREGVKKHLLSAFDSFESNCHFMVLYLDKKKPAPDELEGAFKRLVKEIKKELF